MAEREELIQLMEDAERIGDMETANAVLTKLESMAAQPKTAREKVAEWKEKAIQKNGKYQVGGPVTVKAEEIAGGLVEPAIAMATGAAAYTPAQIGGGIQMYMNPRDPMAGPNARDRIQQSLTYQPRTQQGQVVMQGLADNPVVNTISDIEQAARLGDEALAAGLPEPVARVAEAIPEMAGAAMASIGVGKPSVKQLKDPARFKLSGGKVVKNPSGRKAVSAGWDERAVGYISGLDRGEKTVYRKILNKAKEYHDQFNPKGRPSDIVGDDLARRVIYMKGIKTRNGKLLDKMASGGRLSMRIEVDDLVRTYLDDVAKMGGEVKDGKLVFGPKSLLYKQPGDQQALIAMFDKIKTMANPTGKELHEFKKWLTKYVDYGKSPTTVKEGISGEMDVLLKGYRKAINEKIRTAYDPYAKVNDAYADAAGSLSDLQKAVGPSTDILSSSADAGLGQKLRAVLGNNAKRIQLEDAVGEIQFMTEKYKGKFPRHDLTGQMRFINEMEKMWGPFTETAFKSEIAQAGQRVAEAPGVAQLGREGLRLTTRQIAKMKQSQQAQLKSMERLLSD